MAKRAPTAAPTPDVVRERLFSLPKRFRSSTVDGLSAEWELRIGRQVFSIQVGDHRCIVAEGPGTAPHTTIWVDPATWLAIDEGILTGPQAYMDRRLDLAGNLDLAVRLQTLFRPWHRARRAGDLDQMEVEADGVRLSAYRLGRGRPVLLLHGLGATKISWVPLLGPLSDRHQLVVPDLPGHGESEKPRVDYTPRFYARVVRHLMDELEIERALVVGNSMGGRVALELALRSPNRVAALALLDPAVPGLRWRYLMGFTRVVPTEFGAIPFPLRERWMRTMLSRVFAHPERMGKAAIALAAKDFLRVYADGGARMAFLSSLRHLVVESPDAFWASMRRVKQPALVVVGTGDRIVPSRLGMKLAEELSHGELLLLDDCGHVPQFEALDEILEPLLSFLDSVPKAPKARTRQA